MLRQPFAQGISGAASGGSLQPAMVPKRSPPRSHSRCASMISSFAMDSYRRIRSIGAPLRRAMSAIFKQVRENLQRKCYRFAQALFNTGKRNFRSDK